MLPVLLSICIELGIKRQRHKQLTDDFSLMAFTIIDHFPEGLKVFSLLVIQAKFIEQLNSIN